MEDSFEAEGGSHDDRQIENGNSGNEEQTFE